MRNDGLRFVVTRPGDAGAALCIAIEKQFGRALHFPALAFAPPDDLAAFHHAIAMAGEQDWLIFNSPQSVISSVPALRARWPVLPERVKFAAVGSGTAAALKEAGYLAVHPEDEWSSEGLLNMREFQSPQQQSIMIIKGAGGRELLEKTFLERGARVSACVAYQRVVPDVDTAPLKALIKNHACSAVIAGSFETVANLKLMVGDAIWPELASIPLMVISERIKKLAGAMGFQTIWVTKNASQQAMLDLISEKREVLMSENKELVKSEDHQTHGKSIYGKVILTLGLLVLIGVGGFSAFGYYQLTEANKALQLSLSQVQLQSDSSKRELASVQQLVVDLKNAAEANKQKNESINWPVAEALYLTKLANYYLQLTHDTQKAYLLLQAASELIQPIAGAGLDSVKQALSSNLSALQSAAPSKTEEMYLQLADIYNQLDNLPLAPAPLNPAPQAPEQPKDYSNLPWWKALWSKSMDALGKVVIVRYTGANEMPLVVPEERMFLYQNMHAQMEAAMAGLLHQNPAIYQASLARLNAWIKKYFVQDAQLTTEVLQKLQQLQAVNLQPTTVDLSSTLRLFDDYLVQNKVAQPASTL